MKKLSIVTVNYNNIEGFRETYKSIAEQTFRDFEWIVVDGGSTDGSKEFLMAHQTETSWCCSEKDSGIYNAMNKGILHAEGEYVLFMNSGDTLYESTTIEKVFGDTCDADVIYGNWREIQPWRISKVCHSPQLVNFYHFATRPLCHQTAFIRTSILKESLYDETYRICSDWAKWLELSRKGYTFQHIPVTVCNYKRDGISYHAKQLMEEEHKRLLLEYYEKDEADVFHSLLKKLDKRLRVIRRLTWLASSLLLICLALLIYMGFGT